MSLANLKIEPRVKEQEVTFDVSGAMAGVRQSVALLVAMFSSGAVFWNHVTPSWLESDRECVDERFRVCRSLAIRIT